MSSAHLRRLERSRPTIDAPPRSEKRAPSLSEALAVLDLFSASRRSLAFGQIVEMTGRSDEHCAIVVEALSAAGLLSEKQDKRVFTIGIRSLEFADAYQRENPLVKVCMPFLQAIRNRFNETTMLAVRWGDFRVNIAQLKSDHPVHQDVPEGQRRPLYVGSGGKVLMASMLDWEIEDYLSRVPLERLSQTTMVDRERLLRAIQGVRRDNYSETFSDGNEGGANLATGIRAADGRTIAALVVSVPLYRYQAELRQRLMEYLLNAADEISEQLGIAGDS